MVESVTDAAIVMLDSAGAVVSWNTGAERIKGYRAEEIVGQHFSRFYPPQDIERGLPQRDLDAAAAEGRLEVEGWRVRKDGSTFWANVVFTAIRDAAGNARGFAKLTRDLTERRLVEETLTQAKGAAEKANLAKSDFLSSMSHELRSPLNAILGFAQLMESDTGAVTPSQKGSIVEILRAGWYLLELINEILDLAQIESGKLSLSMEPIVAGRGDPRVPGHDRAAGPAGRHPDDLPAVRRARLRPGRPHPAEAGAHQPALQRGQVQPARRGRSSWTAPPAAPERIRISVKDTGAGLASGEAGAALPAVQPARAGARRRSRAPASAW